MNKILIVTVGIRSHLYTHLGFAERAAELGWQIAIACPMKIIRDTVQSAGYSFYVLKPQEGRMHAPPSVFRIRAFKQEKANAEARRLAIFSNLGLPDVLSDFDPDLVIVDSELHEYILISIAQGRTTAVFEPHFSTERRPNVPVLSDTFIPSDGMLSRLRCSAGWGLFQAKRSAIRLLQRLLYGPNDKHSVITDLASQLRLGLPGTMDTGQWHFYDFPNLVCLRCTIPDIDFSPGSVRPNQVFLGPMIRRETNEARELETLGKVDEFLAHQPDGRPTILLTFGSMLSMKSRVECAIDAVRSKDVSMLVACREYFGSDAMSDLPDNVFVADWLPIVPVLKKVDVAVTHGGPATIQECIDACVPMLLYSMDVRDQNGNVARVCGKNMGLAGSNHDTAADMWRKISHLLAEGVFLENCETMAAELRKYDTLEVLGSALDRGTRP